MVNLSLYAETRIITLKAVTQAVNIATQLPLPSTNIIRVWKCAPISYSLGKEAAFVNITPCTGDLECY